MKKICTAAGSKTLKSFQDLQNELKSIKKRILEIEEKQLEDMILVEDQENLLKTENSNLQKIKAEFISSQSVLLGEKTKLEKDKEHLISEKNANLTSILPESLEVYNKLRTQKNGLAVAIIEGQGMFYLWCNPPARRMAGSQIAFKNSLLLLLWQDFICWIKNFRYGLGSKNCQILTLSCTPLF